MKKRQFIILGSAAAIIVIFVFVMKFLASLKEEPEVRRPPEIKKYVKTSPVRYGDVPTNIIAFGRVHSAQYLDLLSEVAGRMYEGQIRLKEGSRFQKGTLLFYVDDTEAALTLKSQKSNFLRDLAAIMPDLKIDFSSNYAGWEKYFSSLDIDKELPDLPAIKNEKERTFLATKGIFSSYYSIKSAEVRLKKYRYYAPFDGSISEVSLESGAYINAGTRIGRIIRTGALELRVAVETKDIAWVQPGTISEIYSDETQQSWRGEVTRISDFVNQNTQSVDVFVTIDQGRQKIYDGQFLQAAIPARTIKDGMIIPRSIIYNGNEVFVLEDSLLKRKEVTIHRVMENEAIFSGLKEGEEIVMEPLINAHNNMKAYKLEVPEVKSITSDMQAGSIGSN